MASVTLDFKDSDIDEFEGYEQEAEENNGSFASQSQWSFTQW